MAERQDPRTPGRKAPTREDRLKAALKANMARRKAQLRARSAQNTTESREGSSEESS
ncbi:hypothetical protein [Sulfitobacter alexandrii]|uniref:hypothetical protein n=1 Tax=Sulfitobacter alexandrii TaxID=1917485 RepID=UPI000ADDDC23|nr:hypothetical protein [Sulfitobacter alexandrii]